MEITRIIKQYRSKQIIKKQIFLIIPEIITKIWICI